MGQRLASDCADALFQFRFTTYAAQVSIVAGAVSFPMARGLLGNGAPPGVVVTFANATPTGCCSGPIAAPIDAQ